MPDDHDATDKALELLVYGPLGFALYLRDTAPSFVKLFVARGRSVVDEQRKSVGGQLGQARAVGEFATNHGGPHVTRIVTDGITRVREQAETAINALNTLLGNPTGTAPPATGPVRDTASPPPATGAAGNGRHLAIPDYDELSASQVVEHLDGLSRAELDAIRAYETEHRARNTVLGKIEQLNHPVA
ncbi:MAG TPA: hypothetical protein VLV81_06605 [Acidimicrobiia bacterium]|nr:hypothetical protein [Acidimicrobiia bacterium]